MKVAKNSAIVAAIALCLRLPAMAEEPPKSVSTISPIFSQLLRVGHPQGFGWTPVSEKNQPQFYIRESVLNGENVQNWTQMITVTGAKDIASKPEVTPKAYLNNMAGGFKRSCPNSFGAQIINETRISGFDAVAGVVSCGTSPTTGGKTSETALIVVIKGQADVYTVQWAERAAPSNAPIRADIWKWSDRYKMLGPLKLCPIILNEKAPYPSCVGSGEKAPT